MAGASAGCQVTQKNDYPITVMRGHSVSEIIFSDIEIEYTGIENSSVVIALASEGVNRRKKTIESLSSKSMRLGFGVKSAQGMIDVSLPARE